MIQRKPVNDKGGTSTLLVEGKQSRHGTEKNI